MSVKYSGSAEAYHKDFDNSLIRSIRNLYINGMPQRKLAESFGVSVKCIYNIIHGITYSHVDMPTKYYRDIEELVKRKR